MNEHGRGVTDVLFDYELTGVGWARADLRIDAEHVRLSVSYLTDGLGDLVRAAAAIAEGAQDQTVIWAEEPGCHEVAISQRAGSATIQIWHYLGMFPSRMGDIGEPRLHARCSAADFCDAVSSGAQRALTRYGVEGYKELWRAHDFPITNAARLARLVSTTAH